MFKQTTKEGSPFRAISARGGPLRRVCAMGKFMKSDGTAFQSQWPAIKGHLKDKLFIGEVEPTTHAFRRMNERNIGLAEITDIVRFWCIDEMYAPHQYPYGEHARQNPEPVFSITGHDARGRKLTVVFALKKKKRDLWFEIVTVFSEDEHQRNRHRVVFDKKSL